MNFIATIVRRCIKTPLKYALPLLCIGALVLAVSISGCTSPATTSPSPSASSVPTVTSTTTATSTTATATSYLQSLGFTAVQPLVRNGTTAQGYPMYTGTFSDQNGTNYSVSIIHTDSVARVQAEFNKSVSTFQGMGGNGSYLASQTWAGSLVSGGIVTSVMTAVIPGDNVLTIFSL